MATITASPTSASTAGAGPINWDNPSNAIAEDGSVASTSGLGNGSASKYLTLYGFDFSVIPEAASINAVTFRVKRGMSFTLSQSMLDNGVFVFKNAFSGTGPSDDLSSGVAWGTSLAWITYTVTGLSLLASDVKSANFGVGVGVLGTGSNTAEGQVDACDMTITYSSDVVIPYDGFLTQQPSVAQRRSRSMIPY